MQRAQLAEPRPKVVAIQALRALAALSVVLVHLTYGFARHVDGRLAWLPDGEQLAHSAVALFFVISGCVMVLSSGKPVGFRHPALLFWRRRAIRVLPPYWLATGVFALSVVALGQAFDPGFALRSLAFIPAPPDNADGVPFALFLWPGWTLLYELVFYLVFGAFVGLGRVSAVALTGLVLLALTLIGPLVSPEVLTAYAVTRPIMLLFVVGMLFGLAVGSGRVAPAWSRWAAIAAAAGCFFVASDPQDSLGWDYLAWAGLPAALVFFAALAGPLRLPFARTFLLLGEGSYAIYLLHVPIAHLWMRVFNQWWHHPAGSLGYLALSIPLVIAFSLAFHRWIERPMTDGLNRLFGDEPAKRGDLPRTLAP